MNTAKRIKLVPGSLWKRAESWLEPAGTRIPDLDHANVGSDCDWIETESGIAHLRGSAFFVLSLCGGALGAPPCIAEQKLLMLKGEQQ